MADRPKSFIVASSRGTTRTGAPSRHVLGQIVQIWEEGFFLKNVLNEAIGIDGSEMKKAFWFQAVSLTQEQYDALHVTVETDVLDEEGNVTGTESTTTLGKHRVTTDGLDAGTKAKLAQRIDYDNRSTDPENPRVGTQRSMKGEIVAVGGSR